MLNALGAIALIACLALLPDGWTLATAVLTASLVLGIMRMYHSTVMKMTRWAKAHPYRAQGIIAVLQLILMALALYAGYNLRALDIEFSNASVFIFTAILLLGFLNVPFLPRQCTIAIPREVDRSRMAYTAILLSAAMLSAALGNRVGERYPDALLTRALEKIDQAVFPENDLAVPAAENWIGQAEDIRYPLALAGGMTALPAAESREIPNGEMVHPENDASKKTLDKATKKAERKLEKAQKKAERKAKRELRREFRRALAAGSCTAAILLIILVLVPLLCGGICLIILGAQGGSAAAVIGGVILTPLAIWGIVKVAKWCKKGGSS